MCIFTLYKRVDIIYVFSCFNMFRNIIRKYGIIQVKLNLARIEPYVTIGITDLLKDLKYKLSEWTYYIFYTV